MRDAALKRPRDVQIHGPETFAAMRQTLPEGTQASMAVEMGMAGPAVVKAHP